MHTYTATVDWRRRPVDGHPDAYLRAHEWRFDGGLSVPASASPTIVKAPFSDASAIDPEEAFIASISSCHMLWFLHLAEEAGVRVQRYVDEAEGTMARAAAGKYWIDRIVLRPRIEFTGTAPSGDVLAKLHHEAHERCFIANSVKTEIVVEPGDLVAR